MKFRYILSLIFAATFTCIGTSVSYAAVSSITIGSGSTPGASLNIGNSTLTTGNITINGTLGATTGTFNIRGDWINNSETPWAGGSSTVNVEDGPSPVATVNIIGINQFYILNAITEVGKQINFEAGIIQEVSNAPYSTGCA